MRRVLAAILLSGLCSSPAWADRPTDYWTPVTKTSFKTDAQTDLTLWTPATGKSIALQGCAISSDRPVRFELESSNTDVIPPIYLASYGTTVIGGDSTLLWVGSADAALAYTTDGAAAVGVMCWGYEFQQ